MNWVDPQSLHPFERNSRREFETAVSAAAHEIGMDESHVIALAAQQILSLAHAVRNGRQDPADDIKQARQSARTVANGTRDLSDGELLLTLPELAARAVCQARGENPDGFDEIAVLTGNEPYDTFDANGDRYVHAWRKYEEFCEIAVRTTLAAISGRTSLPSDARNEKEDVRS